MKLGLGKRILIITFAFGGLLAIGTIGYSLLEGWHWSDGLFMTVITLSTVGYGLVEPLSESGKLFSILLILLGVGAVTYTFSTVTDYIVAGELRGALRRQRMVKAIDKLQNHYVICGYGRVGRQVVDGLRARNYDVVVIDNDPTIADELEEKDVNYIIGDASADDVLAQAGIERAGGLCTCLPNDAANVFTILSARTVNSNLYIISRSNVEESEQKLRIAGANHVINPYLITGHRMASQLTHPGVVEFLEVVMRQGDLELRIEEVMIEGKSTMMGKTIGECHIRGKTGVNVLAIRRRDGRMVTNLHADFALQDGDALISLGTLEQLRALREYAE